MKEKITIEEVTSRLDTIENLLKMLVVNSLADELDESTKAKGNEQNEISEELKELLTEYDMTADKVELNNGFTLVYISMGNRLKYKTKDFLAVDQQIKGMYERIIPIYQFELINGMQRKRFVEENISFLVYEKETHICAR